MYPGHCIWFPRRDGSLVRDQSQCSLSILSRYGLREPVWPWTGLGNFGCEDNCTVAGKHFVNEHQLFILQLECHQDDSHDESMIDTRSMRVGEWEW